MIPEGWYLTTLGELCEGQLQTGPFGSQLHADEYVDEGIPVLMPKDLFKCRARTEGAAKIPPEKAEALVKHKLEPGDLLFSRRGDVSRFALVNGRSEGALCGTGCLKAKPSDSHSPLFISHFLQLSTVRRWLEQNAVGQTMPNLNTAILAELPLMVPGKKLEQQKIAQILTAWDKAIATTEKLLANSERQKKALMERLLTGKVRFEGFEGEWEKLHFSSLASLGKTKFDPKTSDQVKECIELEHISQGTSRLLASTDTKESASTKTVFTEQSILFGKLRPYLRKYWLADRSGVCSTEIWVLNANRKYTIPEYVFQIVQTDSFINLANKSTGTRMPRADWSLLKDILIPTPPLKEQQVIAATLCACDKKIAALAQKSNYLKQEKQSLMQQLLTGKRRVKLIEEPDNT